MRSLERRISQHSVSHHAPNHSIAALVTRRSPLAVSNARRENEVTDTARSEDLVKFPRWCARKTSLVPERAYESIARTSRVDLGTESPRDATERRVGVRKLARRAVIAIQSIGAREAAIATC